MLQMVGIGARFATALRTKNAPNGVMPVALSINRKDSGKSALLGKVGIELFLDLTGHALPSFRTDRRIALECLA